MQIIYDMSIFFQEIRSTLK